MLTSTLDRRHRYNPTWEERRRSSFLLSNIAAASARARARGRAQIDVASPVCARERVYVLIFGPKVPGE